LKASNEKKEDVDSLRKIIKLNPEESSKEKSEETKPEKKPQEAQKPGASFHEEPGSAQDELGQKRQILQTMKDFDFQIKKNHEDITAVKDRLEGLSKDLDDLVSLYEIVSEQMNPFVGLSKVTKKLLDALENFTREVEELKNRMNEIESVIEVNKGMLGDIEKQIVEHDKVIPKQLPTVPGGTEQKEKSPDLVNEISKPQIIQTDDTIAPISPVIDTVPSLEPSSHMATTPVDWDQILNASFESFLFDLKIENMLDEFVSTLPSQEKI